MLTVAAMIVCTATSLKRMQGSRSGEESPHYDVNKDTLVNGRAKVMIEP